LAGPVTLLVVKVNGSRDRLIGALQYVEPLVLTSLSPVEGTLNGGTLVEIKGQGFRPGVGTLQVKFGNLAVAPEQIQIVDTETLRVVTPGGSIGTVDVEVSLNSGQVGVLKKAFASLRRFQASIQGEGGIIDPKSNLPAL